MEEFSTRLKAARSRRYNSARQFALHLKILPHRYSHWESGRHLPDLNTLTTLCAELGVTPNDLLPSATISGIKNAQFLDKLKLNENSA